MRAGFPHSEILGSKPVCGLPGAYRTLQRPSSPVIAKASTTCTYSLDPITAKPSNVAVLEFHATGPSQRLHAMPIAHRYLRNERGRDNHSSPLCFDLLRDQALDFFPIFKEQTASGRNDQKETPQPALASGVSPATSRAIARRAGTWWR